MRSARAQLIDAWLDLTPYPDAIATLARLAPRARWILSATARGRCSIRWSTGPASARIVDGVLSVDEAGVYKPSPRVYALATKRLRLAPAQIGFVSANGWDAVGAKAFGFTVWWINRAGLPIDRHGPAARLRHRRARRGRPLVPSNVAWIAARTFSVCRLTTLTAASSVAGYRKLDRRLSRADGRVFRRRSPGARICATASRIAAIASGRGKLLRAASAIRREGAGFAKGTDTTSRLWYFGVSASRGSTEMPSPDATMLRTVSSEFVRVTRVSARLSSGQLSSTWSRKQWPTLSRIVCSCVSSSGWTSCASPTCAPAARRPGTAPRTGRP